MLTETEIIIKNITDELNDALRHYHGSTTPRINNSNIISLDIINQEITIKFNYNINEGDNYIGLAFY